MRTAKVYGSCVKLAKVGVAVPKFAPISDFTIARTFGFFAREYAMHPACTDKDKLFTKP